MDQHRQRAHQRSTQREQQRSQRDQRDQSDQRDQRSPELVPQRGQRRLQKRYRNTYLAFVAVLAIVGISALVVPKPIISNIENRQLAALPALTPEALADGSFTKDIAIFYSDTFPFREQLILFSSWLQGLFGLHGDDSVTLYRNTKSINGEDDIVASSEGSNQTAKEFAMDPRVNANANFSGEVRDSRSNIVIIGDTALSLYGYYEPALLDYARTVNTFAARYDGQLETSVVVVPLYSEFRLPEAYKNISDDQYLALSTIYNNLDNNVNKVQIYNTIANHINEYLYFRTDHHWTVMGAWYAYQEYAKSLDMTTQPLTAYLELRIDDFLGSLYSAVGSDPALAANPDYAIAYQPPWEVTVSGYEAYGSEPTIQDAPLLLTAEEVPGSNKYMVFGYEYPYKVVKTSNQTGRKLIVFRESFANAMIPFLSEQYEEIHIVDFRYFSGDINSIIVNENITDALFINNMSSAGNDLHVSQLANVLGVPLE